MLANKYFRSYSLLKQCLCGMVHKNVLKNKFSTKKDKEDTNIDDLLGEIGSKYKVFKDTDSKEIKDVYENKFKYTDLLELEKESVDPLFGLNLQRGLNGVFEIEDLVDVLKRENAEDIFVASVPEHLQYVNYMVIVTGKSFRHMKAIAQFVRRVFKNKRGQDDVVPRLEGENSKEWMALDLGNIALHIFSPEGRTKYDLDTLWAVGPQFDKETNREDPLAKILEKHSFYLNDLVPAR
ncbi:uncharacterized protein K12H4.2 [Onthophagus taurus]|uniref:uncharacterized protein K12H4.2 n=1 Tax=Onthophagus taurus TaxID=166361 RepID=UPI0039BDBB1E